MGYADLYGRRAAKVWRPDRHGERGARLGRLARAGLPVPDGFVVTPRTGSGNDDTGCFDAMPELADAIHRLEARTGRCFGGNEATLLLAIRRSRRELRRGDQPTILNVGMTRASMPRLIELCGAGTAWQIRCRFLEEFACTVAGADADGFELAREEFGDTGMLGPELLAERFARLLDEYVERPISNDAMLQLTLTLRRFERRRGGAGTGELHRPILIQEMVQESARDHSGRGAVRIRGEDGERTEPRLTIAVGDELGAESPGSTPEADVAIRTRFSELVAKAETVLVDGVELCFVMEFGAVRVIDARSLRLSPRGEAAILIDLETAGLISREEALLRIEPRRVEEMLHARVDPQSAPDEICRGIPAAPGAAVGSVAFSAAAAERLANRGKAPVLVKTETDPADVGAMHLAAAMLTSRGGMTSHAAVVARGLGRPCITGLVNGEIDDSACQFRLEDGRTLAEGAIVTVDGNSGRVFEGSVAMLPPDFEGPMNTLLSWADQARRLGIRANADSAHEVRLSDRYGADGIGLCRTEHMFFARGRLTAMREVILADSIEERLRALDQLRPMQHDDFLQLFTAMKGRPVVVRLLDPPLHEFLPRDEAEMQELAAAMSMPVEHVRARAEALEEFNPMLGNRGCRVGIAYPEIYEMQAHTILEAACEAGRRTGKPAVPEIMVPLVSAQREMEILRARINAVAERVKAERGGCVAYRVGAMIETPRAALRAGAITEHAQFLSFGTNDLTQMTYGLSRDDAGRFMPNYLRQGVFPVDPFETVDREGVGELISLAVARAREGNGETSLGLCGEHGADPASIEFCEALGIDYVSCSPFRLPVARLAAAQASIRRRAPQGEGAAR